MELDKLLIRLIESSGVSGREGSTAAVVREFFSEGEAEAWITDLRLDKLGNLIIHKKGKGDGSPKILFAAHMDEIGLMVTGFEEGFLRFSSVGGIDQRVLLGQEVMVHGQRDLPGVIGSKPPHLQEPDEREKAVKMEEMVIDLGLDKKQAESLISIGDVVTINRKGLRLASEAISGKALDDRVGVAALIEALRRLQDRRHQADLYFVATVQEEVGLRGAMVSAYGIAPDLGVAVDVTHGRIPGLTDEESYELGKGPTIVLGPQAHPKIFERLTTVAKDNGINHQIEPATRPGGTDTAAIQLARSGVAGGLLGIPLRYMHTSVETVSLADVRETGRLLAEFAAGVDDEFVEGLKCF